MTPPLFALAVSTVCQQGVSDSKTRSSGPSLKSTTPFFSRVNLACWVMNRLAPCEEYMRR